MAKTRIFLGWSGEGSRQAAAAWNRLLQQIIQQVEPFYSPRIDKGADWWIEVRNALRDSKGLGIFFLTPHNLGAPWLLFEAGAVGGATDETKDRRIWTLEIGPSFNVEYPLGNFQRTKATETDIFDLIQSINAKTEHPLTSEALKDVFHRTWPELQEAMEAAAKAVATDIEKDLPPADAQSSSTAKILASLQRIENQIARPRAGTGEWLSEGRATEWALRDTLTTLANRGAFDKWGAELTEAKTPYVIGLLDLDHFKNVNDQFGHGKGDNLLVLFASVMKEQLPSADIVARIGGDEFAAIFRNSPPSAAAEALTAVIAILPKHAAEAGFPPVTASGGVSSDRIESFALKVRDADRALDQAKREGRARVKIAD